MTNQTIQIKRRNSGSPGAPASLASGEMAWNAVDSILYFGNGDNGSGIATSITKIAGPGAYVLASLLGVASGVATLDSSGKLPAAQLPASITGAMVFQGTWNAATNAPQILSGTGTKGYFYKVSVAGIATNTTTSAAASSAATSISVASASGIAVGNLVTGSGIAAGTTVSAINGTAITLSTATTAAVSSGAALTFSSYLDGVSGSQFQVGDIVTFDGSAWDKIDGPQEAVTTVAGRIGAVVLTSADLTDASAIGRSLLQSVSIAAARGALKIDARTAINDTAYTHLSTDYNAQYTAITAPRVITLVAAASMTAGAEVQIGDSSGNCSGTNTITVAVSGSDLINGATTYVISSAFGQVCLMSDGTSKWTVICQTASLATNVNGGTY
jgi:hypothetical protein